MFIDSFMSCGYPLKDGQLCRRRCKFQTGGHEHAVNETCWQHIVEITPMNFFKQPTSHIRINGKLFPIVSVKLFSSKGSLGEPNVDLTQVLSKPPHESLGLAIEVNAINHKLHLGDIVVTDQLSSLNWIVETENPLIISTVFH